MASVVRLNMCDHALLKKPLNLPAVHRIASQAIYLTTNNALCFSRLYATEHIVKDRATGHFCRTLFNKFIGNNKTLTLGECSQFGELAFNGDDLFVLDIGAFATIKKVFRHIGRRMEKPLQCLERGDEDNIYLIEEELTAVILRLLENKISEVLNLIIALEKVNLTKELKSVFAPQDVKGNLVSFFENLQVADLFLELFEMERNKTILDKQDFYFYFGDISFNNNKYSIFYIPFATTREGDTLNIEFDSQVYINKKALEFIVQEHNTQKGTKGSLQTISERIIYLSQHENDLPKIINDILNELSHFFELEGVADFSNDEPAIARGASVRISNSSYICLFDKSD